MRAVTPYCNFSRAQLDHDLNGRFDLPIYQTGAEAITNFITNFKGNLIYRTGHENMTAFQDCGFMEFKFSKNQNYILVLYEYKMRFLTYDINGNFGWVLSGGLPLEVTTPWTLAQSKAMAKRKSYAQNADAMIICDQSGEPRKLLRTSASSFTLLPYARKGDLFITGVAAGKSITGVTQASAGVVSCTAHGYTTGDRVRISGIAGMTELNTWVAAVTVIDANSFSIDVDTRSYTAYSSGGTVEKVTAGVYPKTCCFYKGRLYYANTPTAPTTIYGSEVGQYFIHTLPASTTADTALRFTIAELSQEIDWLMPGDNSLIAGAADGVVAINGGSPGEPITASTVEATLTPADGAGTPEPIRKDTYVFYVGEDLRNLYYFNYDILNETFVAQDANFAAFDITIGGLTKARHQKGRENLIWALRADGVLCSLNFFKPENIVGWHEHSTAGTVEDIAVITDNEGRRQLFILAKRAGSYYIERRTPYVEFARRVKFSTGDEEADNEAHYRLLAEQLKQCNYLDNASSFSDLRSASLTYDSVAGTITAGSSSFVSGDVGKHIVYKTATGYESGRFKITSYTSNTVVEVDVLQEPTSDSYASWYLSFSTVTGLSRFDGEDIAVVADGSYIGDFPVSGGEIDLDRQVTHVWVGRKYRGLVKTFTVGFQVQTENTQVTPKTINAVGVRTVNSVGGKVGASMYQLEELQSMSPADLNYLPPLPLNGTKLITFIDEHDVDKSLYIVQDEPGPLHVTATLIDADHVITR